jgi:hypothetical protein
VQNTKLTEDNSLPREVDVELDVLRVPVMHRVHSHVDAGDVVAVDDGGLGHGDMELPKQLAKPAAFCNNIGDDAVLSLHA